MICSRIEDDVFRGKSGSFHECQRLVSWLKGFRKPEFVGDHPLLAINGGLSVAEFSCR
jgi:hypothetical protein